MNIYEGLLFSDVAALCQTVPGWQQAEQKLTTIRGQYASPEHINDGYASKPSARLATHLSPRYDKMLHAPLAAERVTVAVMEQQCRHFCEWLGRLRALANAQA
ncbi:DUF4276 family protein [Candidatus Magnetaquicoccus inordinatus]|uniref:DUF4276 family protein n=1 Tax=Candidatus Magnetaquicoccus inordinatus TaxID=2496818 RepID=UPI00187D5AD2|nr:DUF4276 family protein [Candidatus Magnetaquicoccus inordinatus]